MDEIYFLSKGFMSGWQAFKISLSPFIYPDEAEVLTVKRKKFDFALANLFKKYRINELLPFVNTIF